MLANLLIGTLSFHNSKIASNVPDGVPDGVPKLLLERQDLPLSKVILLDRIQKRQPITDDAANMLRKAGLIEGRKPGFFVSAKVAAATNSKPVYTRNRGIEKARLKEFVLQHIREFVPDAACPV